VTFSELANFQRHSVARPLCDCWASCYRMYLYHVTGQRTCVFSKKIVKTFAGYVGYICRSG